MTKFMSREAAKADAPNPYNREKEWDDEGKTGEEFVSADDSLAHVAKKKYAVIDPKGVNKQEEQKQQEETKQEEDPTQVEATPHKRIPWQKRYTDLQSYHSKRENEWKQKLADAEQRARDARPKFTPPRTAEELATFQQENSDLYAVVQTIAHQITTQEQEDLKAQLKRVNERLAYEEARAAYAELLNMVPDFERIKMDPEFHKWAQEQPQEIQTWVYENGTNAQLAAQAINLYKASMGLQQPVAQKQPVKQPQPDAAEAVRPGRTREEERPQEKIWTASEIKAMSLEDYEANQKEIQKALVEGRVMNG